MTTATIDLSQTQKHADRNSDPLLQALIGETDDLGTEIEVLKSRYMTEKMLSIVDFQQRYFIHSGLKKKELYKNSPFVVTVTYLDNGANNVQFQLIPVGTDRFALKTASSWVDTTEKALYRFLNMDIPAEPFTYSGTHRFGDTISTSWFTIKVSKLYPLESATYSFILNNSKTDLAKMITRNIQAILNKNTSIIQVSYVDTVPLRAQDVTNALCESYIAQGLELQALQAKQSLQFIDNQLASISENLKQSESKLEGFKKQHTFVDINALAGDTLQKLSGYESDQTKIDLQLNILASIEQFIQTGKDLSGISMEALDFSTPLLSSMIESLQKKQLERKVLLLEYTEQHPEVIKINEQINILKKNIGNNISSIEKNLKKKKQSIDEVISQQKASLSRLPEKEMELAGLQRSFMINEKVYTFLLQQRVQTSVLQASTVSNTRIVDTAIVPDIPVKPQKGIVLAIALLLGLILGIFQAYFRNFLDYTIKTREDIQLLTKIPIYGLIPVIKSKLDDAFLETFRVIRTNLLFITSDNPCKTIVITSSSKGEGKSTTVFYLAKVFGQGGKKVIALDLDLRRPRLHQIMKVGNRQGLSTLLAGHRRLDEVITATGMDNVSLLPAGPIPPNPSELIMSEKLTETIATLAKSYDYILIDTPPVGLLTDAMLVMKNADITLLITKAAFTTREEIKEFDQMIQHHQLASAGIIMNGITVEKRGRYGYGYGYGYGYTQE